MVKIKNKRKLKVYLKDYDSGIISQELAAKCLGITPRRFRYIHKKYGNIPAIGINLGRPKKEIPEEWKEIIKEEYEKFRQNAVYSGKRIPHNTIHKVMLEFGFAKEQESKQKRRKPWIRYEKKHSLSAVHSDYPSEAGIHVCSIEHTCLRPPVRKACRRQARLGSIGMRVKSSRESSYAQFWMMHLEKSRLLVNLIMLRLIIL